LKGDEPIPHDVLQPAKTFSERIVLTNQEAAAKIPIHFILTVENGKTPEQDEFYSFYLRAQSRGWSLHVMEGDHNVQRSHVPELVRLLEAAR